ncbi:hypothetical protein FA13DRAFT_1808500 [Coprinellus micaceus]|uniref:Uncharacterized protein n=1 Tax=Coprinellus micaceus TaxID=71717 RepID=A0A4Y7TX37_COPMI|nr:hypothetical protein FA13DRAFT_1808500 [Coprinellus micaceus]
MAPLTMLLKTLITASFVAFSSASHLPRSNLQVSPNPPCKSLTPLAAYANDGNLTNAERMKRGLALKKPRFGGRTCSTPRRQDTSATPCNPHLPLQTPEPTPEPLCTGRTGVIRAHAGNPSPGDPFLSKTMNAFGEYGTTSSLSGALTVTLCGDSGAFSIWGTNGPISDLPFLGGISGAVNSNDNMSPSSYNYAYVGATVQTANGSPAVSGDNSFSRATGNSRKIESAIWSLGSNDQLTTSWVNSNGREVNGVIVHVVSGTDDSFVFTAGYSSYVDMFGPSPIWNFSFEEL